MKIGLGIIARNEELDLPACLHTYLPHVDCAVILDTGSTDKTLEIAKEICGHYVLNYKVERYLEASDSDGRLVDFAKARNQYITMLEEMGVDYIVSADADDRLINDFTLRDYIQEHPADIYAQRYHTSETNFFYSFKIWKTGYGLRFVGRVHECLNVDWKLRIHESEIKVYHHFSRYDNQEDGTARNLRILRSEIYPPLRSLFYWANENMDAKNYKEAVKWWCEYIRRVKEDGEDHWPVELAHCYFRAARWVNFLGDQEKAVELSKELLAKDPSWSESWCELAYIAQCRQKWDVMRECCVKALSNPYQVRLFSEKDKYTTVPSNMLVWLDMNIKSGNIKLN